MKMWNKQRYSQYKEQQLAWCRKYYQKNKSKRQKYSRDFYQKHAEYYKNYNTQYRVKNAGAIKQSRELLKNIMHDLKINGCAICGYDKCDTALEFHHINSEDKKFYIVQARITDKQFINEVNKCMLLCAICHIEIHAKEVKNA